MSDGKDFPYTMRDVAGLLPLKIRHRKATSIDVDCPFCNDKDGKLNINFEKQVFNCNRCRTHGGMVELYAKYFGITNVQANSEIYSVVCQHQSPRGPVTPMPEMPVCEQAPARASAQVIDQTLRTMLELLPLTPTHRAKLLERGLTAEQIEMYGYRSTPAFGYRKLARQMLGMGCQLQGVPGFYQTREGDWTLACNPKCTGFFIPVMSVNGQVQGCQIRLDHPFKGCKYIWFSSTDKRNGTPSGSPVHFVGDPAAKEILITEGPLKATIAHCLSGKTFLAVAGANQHAALSGVLDTLKRRGTETVYEALDMDKFQNVHVANGSAKMIALAKSKGFTVRQLRWNPAYKGIDDYFLSKRPKE